MGTIQFDINKTRVVGGMAWEPSYKTLKADLKIHAAKNDARFGCHIPLHGTAVDIQGEPSYDDLESNEPLSTEHLGLVGAYLDSGRIGGKVFSLAAWFYEAASKREKDILYIRPLQNGQYYILALVNGEFRIDTDIIVDSQAAISVIDGLIDDCPDLKYFVEKSNRPAPSAQMLPRISRLDLSTIVEFLCDTPLPKSARVRQVRGIKPITVIAAAALALLGVIGLFLHHQMERQRAAEQLERYRQQAIQEELTRQRLNNLAEIRQAEAVAKAAADDTNTPVPSQLVANCLHVVQNYAGRIAGWQVEQISCDGEGQKATVELSRARNRNSGNGTSETLHYAFAEVGLVPNIDPISNKAVVSVPLPMMTLRQPLKPTELPLRNDVMLHLPSRLQLAEATGAVNYAIAKPAKKTGVTYVDPHLEATDPAKSVQPVPAAMLYDEGKITVSGDDPWKLGSVSLDYPFCSIKKLSFSVRRDLSWQMEVVYVFAT